jgi:imipenem/basic amino acid-specific outer membrane pore
MKKLMVSFAAAAVALSTSAMALEDIKVSGQAKLWYETNNKGDNDMFNKDNASGEVVFKLGVTGKQGNVGFGATLYDSSTMGLEGLLVSGVRTDANNLVQGTNDQLYVGEAYITAPVAPDTTLKFGKQELDTPFVFTERWNAAPNTFNAAVAINQSVENLALVAAYVGQTSGMGTAGWKTTGTPVTQINDQGAFAFGGLYKADGLGVNGWYYAIPTVADAFWLDAGVSVAGVNLKGIVAGMMPRADGVDDTMGYALSAGMAVGGVKLMAAASMIGEDGVLPLANVGTGFKKTKLPTAGVYTDGVYVAQPDSTAFKLKAAGKIASTGLALQGVMNQNDSVDALETTEVDLIVTQKLGDFNFKGILIHRAFEDDAVDDAAGGQHVRLIASVNF